MTSRPAPQPPANRDPAVVSVVDAASFYREPPRGDLPRWSVAGLVVVLLHLGIAAFLLNRQPASPPAADTEAVLVDLQPPSPDLHAAPVDTTLPAAPAPEATKTNEEPPKVSESAPAPPPPEVVTPPPAPVIPPPAVTPPPPPEAPALPVAAPPIEAPPMPEVPVLPKVEAPIEQPKPETTAIEAQQNAAQEKKIAAQAAEREAAREAQMKRQQEIKRAQEAERQQAIREQQQKRDEARRQEQVEARRRADEARRGALEKRQQAQQAASRVRAARESQAHTASAASMGAWTSEVLARIRGNVAGGSSSSATIAFTVSSGGRIGGARVVSGSGEAASAGLAAVRGTGSVPAPPDGRPHPVTVPIRFN